MSRRRTIEAIERSLYVTISELVQLTGMRYSTLKYYTEEGMIPFHQEESRLTRRYDRIASIKRIQEIKKLKDEGLTVSEIKRYLKHNEENKQGKT